MSSWEKLINNILNLSSDMRFEELQKVLESLGYTVTTPRGGSSHYTFRKQGAPAITIPKKKKIKKIYVKLVKEAIEREEV